MRNLLALTAAVTIAVLLASASRKHFMREAGTEAPARIVAQEPVLPDGVDITMPAASESDIPLESGTPGTMSQIQMLKSIYRSVGEAVPAGTNSICSDLDGHPNILQCRQADGRFMIYDKGILSGMEGK